ncbi:MAG: SDR family oxidoreductase [Planctomycetota bacterium]|nr:SDR family oxidoreductase [Planctomycetota bacterium]
MPARALPKPAKAAKVQPSGDQARRVALVVGGARRVGAAIALELARAGLDIIVTYRSSADEARDVVERCRELGVNAEARKLELSKPALVESFARRLGATSPRLDVLVLSASVYRPSPLAETTAAWASECYAVNALAPLLLCKHLGPLLASSSRGGQTSAVVAMGDIHAMGRPRKDFAAYSMSKAALLEMVQCLARDLAPKVRVNAVAPGVVAWPESGYESTPEMQRAYVSRVPLARAGTPEDAAEIVAWLALGARYVTGQIVRADGGRWLA